MEIVKSTMTPYKEALNCLSSLIIPRTRADASTIRFDLMFDYLKILELEGPVSQLNVIHVAGTKGKGSTCTFVESILRNCGFRTGLFTSPHLIDVRERFKIDGVEISQEKFLTNFWWCWNRLREKTNDDVPMPFHVCFLALLAFKIFSVEKVDVAILEVGLGGKYDATNVVKAPIVCGISSLGYDHMEILGNTLGQIAGEKAGIFKQEVPAYTVPQPEEAMSVLRDQASHLSIPLRVVSPLDTEILKDQQLGLHGEHQYLNAGLAIALSKSWLQRTGHEESIFLNNTNTLPEQFVRGLTMANLPGRAQIISDPSFEQLVFYLDGAHTPESLEVCGKWFSSVVREETQSAKSCKSEQILLFTCLSVRDPRLLLPPLVNSCASHGIRFTRALFVLNQSAYNMFGAHATTQDEPQVDVSWQLTLQKVWDNLIHGGKGKKQEELNTAKGDESSSVFPSLPLALNWLRENAQRNKSIRSQVLVTGSLHLVGDVLRLIKK
ncbi:uncharacterized protein A4U43_C08F36110 [Asparagus officinalis]|uniref:folylpolyglutamate synthase-like isoform X2 n=1 Tax=Asparagus officinalis TaxID=4686 RepID=UPI00098E6D09|nr:folylpolyglutamate synthase-like isoform X2 [Asparagus officinalis]ONK62034.1 uncharacterized protein A4U43_C08F36110 [Asparagus officinalis]